LSEPSRDSGKWQAGKRTGTGRQTAEGTGKPRKPGPQSGRRSRIRSSRHSIRGASSRGLCCSGSVREISECSLTLTLVLLWRSGVSSP
jgi:hypothetical protein